MLLPSLCLRQCWAAQLTLAHLCAEEGVSVVWQRAGSLPLKGTLTTAHALLYTAAVTECSPY